MSDWMATILLGLIEGATEFLPVSSTGHLLLAEEWLGLGKRSELFNVVIQGGAVLAVLAVFWDRAMALLTGWQKAENRDYLSKLFVAFVITAVGGLLMKKMGWKLDKTPAPVAWATLIGGVLFIAVETFLKGRSGTTQISWLIALAVGAGQLVAVAFPGASRSGTTILFALMLGLTRPAAAEFSFPSSPPSGAPDVSTARSEERSNRARTDSGTCGNDWAGRMLSPVAIPARCTWVASGSTPAVPLGDAS